MLCKTYSFLIYTVHFIEKAKSVSGFRPLSPNQDPKLSKKGEPFSAIFEISFNSKKLHVNVTY
jgi:hypothetical protein